MKSLDVTLTPKIPTITQNCSLFLAMRARQHRGKLSKQKPIKVLATWTPPSMDIIKEILEFRLKKVKAGEMPKRIELSAGQKARLKAWAKSQQKVLIKPDGSAISLAGFDYNSGRIFGMDYDP